MAFGVSKHDQIVGTYYDSNGTAHGFLDLSGTFQSITNASANTGGTIVTGINAKGTEIVGYYNSNTGDHGFIYSDGAFTPIDDPLVTGGFGTIVNGINDKGQAVGYYTTSSTNGFLYSHGTYTTIDVPGATATVLQGINDKGQIVGYYELGTNNTPHGFLYSGGTFISIDEPLATNGTTVNGINDSGELVGYYQDSIGVHGFVATARTLPTFQGGGPHGVTSASDSITVGQGNDTFIFPQNLGENSASNFNVHQDVVEFSKSEFAQISAMLTDAHQLETNLPHDANHGANLEHAPVTDLHAQNYHLL